MVILLILLASMLSLSIAGAQPQGAKVSRIISLSDGGVVYVWDKISGLGPGSEIGLGIPTRVHGYLAGLWSEGGDVEGPVQDGGGDTVFYRIRSDSDTLVVRHVYAGLLSAASSGTYSLTSPSTPLLEGVEYTADTQIILPDDATVNQAPQGYTINGTRLIRAGYSSEQDPQRTVSLTFSSNSIALVVAEKVELLYDAEARLVTIWLRIRSIDARNIIEAPLSLPRGVRPLEAGDRVGTLGLRVSGQRATVSFYPERYELLKDWRYEFYLKAAIDGEQDNLRIVGDKVYVKVFLPLNATAENPLVRVTLPRGMDVTHPEAFREIYRDDAGRLVVTLPPQASSPYRVAVAEIAVRPVAPSAPLPQILLTVLLVAAVVGAVTYAGSRPAKAVTPMAELSDASLRKYMKDLAELRGLLEELDEILGLSRGDIKKINIQASVARVRSKFDDVREAPAILGMSERDAKLVRELLSSVERCGETLKLMQRNFLELQRGELSRASYLKMYRALREDLRGVVARIGETEESLRRLVQR
jgi:hypothetical protein